jgi:hypothetical protein
MTRNVSSAGRPRRLAGWVALGVALAAAAQGRAESLVSQFGQPASPGVTRGSKPWEGPPARFAVAADPGPRVGAAAARRAPLSPGRRLREQFLREHGAEMVTLFFGYYGAFLPPPDGPPVTAPTTPPTSVQGSPPDLPPPPPGGGPIQRKLPPFGPPAAGPITQAPEPATLLSGLTGAGLAWLLAWRRRRKARAAA